MRDWDEVPVSMQAVTGLTIAITIFWMCDSFGIVARETVLPYVAGILTIGVAGLVSAPIAWVVWRVVVIVFWRD